MLRFENVQIINSNSVVIFFHPVRFFFVSGGQNELFSCGSLIFPPDCLTSRETRFCTLLKMLKSPRRPLMMVVTWARPNHYRRLSRRLMKTPLASWYRDYARSDLSRSMKTGLSGSYRFCLEANELVQIRSRGDVYCMSYRFISVAQSSSSN